MVSTRSTARFRRAWISSRPFLASLSRGTSRFTFLLLYLELGTLLADWD